jgi:iron transport multicopper oxidase
VLINGVGRYVGGPDLPFVVINVQPLKRYRFRLLDMACKSNYIFSIDDHYLTVIEVDGEYVQPMVVNSIQIFPGQRYSFVLEANQPPDNYWLHANPDAGGNATAILRYTGSPSINPKNRTTPNSISLNETSLHPLTPPWTELQRDADIKLDLVVGFNQSHFLFYINGVQYIPPTVPVLLQILSGAMTVADLLPNGTVYTLPKNKVVDITFNTDTAAGGPVSPFSKIMHSFID